MTTYNMPMIDLHNYNANMIWNCDEFDAQASCNGGIFVLTKVGSKLVHSIIPNERKWLLVLSLHQCTWKIHSQFLHF